MTPDSFRRENVCDDAQRLEQEKSRVRRDRNLVKTADLTFILNVQITGSLVHVVQHEVHRDEHQGERQCRQNETVAVCASVK